MKIRKSLSWSIVVVGFFLGIAGIKALEGLGDRQRETPTVATRVIEDVRGRRVRVPKKVTRAYYPYYYQNLLSVAGPDAFEKVVATSTFDTANYSGVLYNLLKERSAGFDQAQDVGSTLKGSFDIEKLIALNPDVVILTNYQYDGIGEGDIKHLDELGIPVIFIDYTDLSPAAHYQSTTILGQVFDTQNRAKALNQNYQRHITNVAQRLKLVKKKKRVCLEQRSSGASFAEYGKAYGDGMLMGTLAKAAGADNIYRDQIQTTGDVNPEFLFAQDPDVIFIDGTNYADPRSVSLKVGYGISPKETQQSLAKLVAQRPGFSQLKAVQSGQLYALDNHLMRTMKDYVLIEYMAKSLYPELFTDLKPEKNLQDFNEKYLPDLADKNSFLAQWDMEKS
ncbi:ABC transporter substrate-binding protein [Fructobacillus cardui]|uniref:ABC transporter substrate-binding protein n=1 Tax=Fructobacillus cardui TaxID=2893170 RepID=UPI00200A791E|nr:ABC transporter substrate-binding protein [Fructobacillus cardui]MCK8627615.1 ABC transporter substrate-binding protein [Fructobacillus cardui]